MRKKNIKSSTLMTNRQARTHPYINNSLITIIIDHHYITRVILLFLVSVSKSSH